MSDNLVDAYSRARLDDRQVTELIGIARGMLADGQLHDLEIDALQSWLVATASVSGNPLLDGLRFRIEEVLSDAVVDDEERLELLETLSGLCGGHVELGELLRSSSLPLCKPAPSVAFDGNAFLLQGNIRIRQSARVREGC